MIISLPKFSPRMSLSLQRSAHGSEKPPSILRLLSHLVKDYLCSKPFSAAESSLESS